MQDTDISGLIRPLEKGVSEANWVELSKGKKGVLLVYKALWPQLTRI